MVQGILIRYFTQEQQAQEKVLPDDLKKWKRSLIEKLKSTSNEDFLPVYNDILREILIKQGYDITESMTLFELKRVKGIS